MPDRIEILPISGLGEITPGTDLAAAIHEAAPWLQDLDVLVVTSKIISKAEGQLVDVPPAGPLRDAARDDILAAETARVVARRGATRIVQTHHGFVMAAAGIDASNVDPSQLVLLPKDPDSSARALRTALREEFGLDVAVIVSDTMGRPWRVGLTDVALGAAGLAPIVDYRGELDPYGNEMHLTQMAIIDELSGAAELVKGKFDRVPVGVVRGFLTRTLVDDGAGARSLVREADQDLFALGTAEARAAGLARAATLTDAGAFAPSATPPALSVAPTAAPGPDAVAAIVARVPVGPSTNVSVTEAPADAMAGAVAAVRCRAADPTDEGHLVELGTDLHRLRCALAAEGLATMRQFTPGGVVLIVGPALG